MNFAQELRGLTFGSKTSYLCSAFKGEFVLSLHRASMFAEDPKKSIRVLVARSRFQEVRHITRDILVLQGKYLNEGACNIRVSM